MGMLLVSLLMASLQLIISFALKGALVYLMAYAAHKGWKAGK